MCAHTTHTFMSWYQGRMVVRDTQNGKPAVDLVMVYVSITTIASSKKKKGEMLLKEVCVMVSMEGISWEAIHARYGIVRADRSECRC